MNINELKAFIGDKPSQQNPDVALRQQLQEIGLKQAQSFNATKSQASVSLFSSQTSVGLRVYTSSLNQSLSINNINATLPVAEEKQSSLFDFEEVAKNVLRFVGGALKNAAAKGSDEETLLNMFEQAKSGVLKGIELAEKDLAGFLNDEIKDGITRSKALIDEGIQSLESSLLNRSGPEVDNQKTIEENVAYKRSDAGELNIRTRDGDHVSIRFEDIQQFEFNQQQIISQTVLPTNTDRPKEVTPKAPTEKVEPQPNTFGLAPEVTDEVPVVEPKQSDEDSNLQPPKQLDESYLFVEKNNLSFSVRGQLDQQELQAIGDLVNDANDLTELFFDDDIEGAFQNALELGYNQQELSGFALQLTKRQQVQVVSAYERISNFNEGSDSKADPVQTVKPVSQYLDKMLGVLEQAQQRLQDNSAYEQLVNGIVNQVGKLETSDLVSAINRFHTFNNQLLGSIPAVQETDESFR
jgi:hypothetical protein